MRNEDTEREKVAFRGLKGQQSTDKKDERKTKWTENERKNDSDKDSDSVWHQKIRDKQKNKYIFFKLLLLWDQKAADESFTCIKYSKLAWHITLKTNWIIASPWICFISFPTLPFLFSTCLVSESNLQVILLMLCNFVSFVGMFNHSDIVELVVGVLKYTVCFNWKQCQWNFIANMYELL